MIILAQSHCLQLDIAIHFVILRVITMFPQDTIVITLFWLHVTLLSRVTLGEGILFVVVIHDDLLVLSLCADAAGFELSLRWHGPA